MISQVFNKGLGTIEASPIVKLAALVIIFAGAIYAKTIIAPFLLALFISIISIQPITWLEKKGVPRWVAIIIVILGLILIFFGFSSLIGGTLTFFLSNVSKYESTVTTISKSIIQFLNEKGLKIPEDQIATLIQPAKILEFTTVAVRELFKMLGNTFLIFLIILFILMEFGSFSDKAKVINIGSIIATIPAFLFALVQLGLGGALWTLGSFMVIHNVLGNFIEPKLMGRGLGLSTLVVLLSLLFWGFILGLVGMFLAVPFTLTIKIILEQNEKTRWLAILLGTPDEAKIYLQHKELMNKL